MRLMIANKLYSSWSLRPWLLMKAMQMPFKETVIPLRQPETAAAIKAFDAAGKVPVLVVNEDIRIWESLAIIEYLAEVHRQQNVWPANPVQRAHARSIANEMHAGFQPLRAACPMNLSKRFAFKDYGADVVATVARIETIWREARAIPGAAGPFLYGAFSAADAMYAPVVTRLDTYGWPVAADTRAYMDAVLSHPAFVAWRTDALAEPRAWDIADYEAGFTPIKDLRAS
jgi:glutathione S-transferase